MDRETQKYLLKESYRLALNSEDPSTQNGAMLVDRFGDCEFAWGWNRFPKGVQNTPERWERPLKYKIIEHAERSVIYQCAKAGIATEGLTMVCCWAACSDCARAIIDSGIKTLVTHKQAAERSPPFWAEEIRVAFTMLEEAGVNVELFDGDVGFEGQVRHSGELWRP